MCLYSPLKGCENANITYDAKSLVSLHSTVVKLNTTITELSSAIVFLYIKCTSLHSDIKEIMSSFVIY